jgi:pimeloyl-ACP methyl ester carboxylesterase
MTDIFFVHGFNVEPKYYGDIIGELSGKNRFVFDVNLHDFSPKPSTLDDYVYEVFEWKEKKKLRDYFFVGHSMGGGVGYKLADGTNEIKKLVGINPLTPTDYGARGFLSRGIKVGKDWVLKEPRFVFGYVKNFLSEPLTNYRLIKDLSEYSMENLHIFCPTLLLYGENEQFFDKNKVMKKCFHDELEIKTTIGDHCNTFSHPKLLGKEINKFLYRR